MSSSDDDFGDGKPQQSFMMDACGEVTALQHTTTPYGDFIIAGTAGGVVSMVCLEYDGNMVLQKIDQYRSLLDRLSSATPTSAMPVLSSSSSRQGGDASVSPGRRSSGVVASSPLLLASSSTTPLLQLQRVGQKLSLPMSSLTTVQSVISTTVQSIIPNNSAGVAGIPPRSSSAPLSKTAVLWKRALSATRKEREGGLNARGFTQFRYSAQERMQVHIDDIVVLQASAGMSVSATGGFEMYSPRGGVASASVTTVAPYSLPVAPLSASTSARGGAGNPLSDTETTPRPPVSSTHDDAKGIVEVIPVASPRPYHSAPLISHHPLTIKKPQSQLDQPEEPAFLVTLTAAGDCKLLCASTRSSLEEEALPETLGSFPATTADGCGGQIACCGETLWVADDSGHLSEFRIAISDIQSPAPMLFKGGCKHSLRVPVELVRVTKFPCGIRAIVVHEQRQIVVLGLESGRCAALRSVDGSPLWGQAPITSDLTPKELLLKHRFQFCFKPVPGVTQSPADASSPLSARGGSNAARKFQGVAKAVARMVALKQPEKPIPSQLLPPALAAVVTTSATISASCKDAYLALVMKGAPAHLKKGVVERSDDDNGCGDPQSETTAKTASLKFRDRSDDTNDVSRSCFSRLKLNDVSGVLSTRPASAAPLFLNPVQSRGSRKKKF
ncbi:Hypothetical protein, putative [Bodo saltans]|uniref:Uncharacterized protein n=1 Tax=Bodo saltans TaxID=75058 RepID=A0A0S4JTA8_BODSA|nr:Hypothetical protein, putative [Bodo saltans]|eukprot:CUG91802.1 Hypothetical protein, putative [Bodo saltans]